MLSKQLTALVIIFLYMVLTVVVGLVSSKRKQAKKAQQSNDDFLMAGKSLGPLVLAGTLFAANTGGASTTGIATNVYSYGLSAAWYVIAAGIGFVLVSFIAPYFRKAQASTVPQIIGKRYGKASHIFTAFTSIAALFMATGAQIIATASIINVVTGLSFQVAAVIITVVVIAYTMVGGFASVAAANLMHVLFITVGMTIAMFAIQLWMGHTIERIEEMIPLEADPALKKNLMEMAEVNKRILTEAPRTMREACQWLCWFNMASRTYNRDGAGGQLDELLRPYYERDLKAGLIDDEDAVYYIACLLLNDTHYYQLGGPDGDGRDVTSHISYLILEAADRIDTSCNLTLRVHEGLPEDFFLKAVGYLFRNQNGWPRFSGDKALVEGFVKNGYPPELARKRIAVGCNWMSLPGLEYTLNDLVKINTARVFEVAFDEMMGLPEGEWSVERLWELFTAHLVKAVDVTVESMRFHMRYQVFNEPELLLNLLSHGPVEKGHDVTDGGAAYYNLAIDGAGIAVVADSFACLEQRIEKEHRLSWEEISRCVKEDYEGKDGEYIRKMMTSVARYGSGGSEADRWGEKLSSFFAEAVHNKSFQGDSYCFIPGWFSWANTIDFGKAVGATPNGRKAGTPINHGANPMPGFRKDGAVTAMANTIAAIQPGYGNTAPIQLELDPGLVQDEESVKKIADLIRTIFEKGATLLNINIIDEKKILAAHKDPSLYPDLVVRVTGFTAYFSMLSQEFRQLVVDRIIAKE